MSLISITDIKPNTAYSLDARLTIDDEILDDNQARMDLYSQHISGIAPELLLGGTHSLAADAYCSKYRFVSAVVSSGAPKKSCRMIRHAFKLSFYLKMLNNIQG